MANKERLPLAVRIKGLIHHQPHIRYVWVDGDDYYLYAKKGANKMDTTELAATASREKQDKSEDESVEKVDDAGNSEISIEAGNAALGVGEKLEF